MGCIECWGAQLVAFTLRFRLPCRRRRPYHHLDPALGSGAKRRKGVARRRRRRRHPRVSSRVPPFRVMDETRPLSLPDPHLAGGEAAVSVSRTFGTRVSVPLHLRSPSITLSRVARCAEHFIRRNEARLLPHGFFLLPPTRR